MFCEFPPNENLSRLVRAYMCLNEAYAPGHFFAPAMKRMGIVVTVRNNVEITCDNRKIVPPVVSMKGVFELPYYFSYINESVTSFAADLHPIGMYELTGKTGAFFKNSYIDASGVWTEAEVKNLFAQLSLEITLQERAALFDDFLQTKAPSVLSEKSLLVERADAMAKDHQYQCSVKLIASELSVSEKMLTRAFKKVLGVTPKQYFTSALFEEIVRRYAIDQKSSITDFLESPFYDFSHINKWFKKYTQVAPSEFVNFDMHSVAQVIMHHN